MKSVFDRLKESLKVTGGDTPAITVPVTKVPETKLVANPKIQNVRGSFFVCLCWALLVPNL
uniref:Uncharacterized protein n=1 Tax=Oryza meridionalis TaxID=40149 RepID=A0A0E0DBC2_9ORYZ